MDAFEELMEEICKASDGILNNAAREQIPGILFEKTKKKILKSGKSPEELAIVFEEVIKQIENGRVEPVDYLVRKKLGFF